MKIALFASGKGTNVENIIRYFNGNKSVNISVIYSNNKNSGAILHAKKHQILGILLKKEDLFFSNKLVNELNSNQIDLVVLAGFLLKIPRKFIEGFNGKIINVHPSLLPKYGGKGMYGDNIHKLVLSNKEKKTGITFHYVNENYDEGKIIAQYEIEVDSNETLNSLKKKISREELLNYPKIISSFLNE
ncbi:formyltransferase family protein [bacterium]|jgi:phosphoribosylglycinamide formyltransferase-1|nr:formyltransferase family protein [bacterium]